MCRPRKHRGQGSFLGPFAAASIPPPRTPETEVHQTDTAQLPHTHHWDGIGAPTHRSSARRRTVPRSTGAERNGVVSDAGRLSGKGRRRGQRSRRPPNRRLDRVRPTATPGARPNLHAEQFTSDCGASWGGRPRGLDSPLLRAARFGEPPQPPHEPFALVAKQHQSVRPARHGGRGELIDLMAAGDSDLSCCSHGRDRSTRHGDRAACSLHFYRCQGQSPNTANRSEVWPVACM